MKEPEISQIPIDTVLLNVSEELAALSKRLAALEKIIFESEERPSAKENRKQIQDMDLIIQQISDLARTIHCVTEVELSGRFVSADLLAERLHLKDLKDRLVNADADGQGSAADASIDIHFF